MRSNTTCFLTVEDVVRLHERAVERDGGSRGVRDTRLLESAVAMPQQTAFGQPVHPTLPAQAAAYMFHISKNHPFHDGNKRTALAACEAFLNINGKELTLTDREAKQLAEGVAAGRVTKEQLTQTLEERTKTLEHVSPEQAQKQQREQTRAPAPTLPSFGRKRGRGYSR